MACRWPLRWRAVNGGSRQGTARLLPLVLQPRRCDGAARSKLSLAQTSVLSRRGGARKAEWHACVCVLRTNQAVQRRKEGSKSSVMGTLADHHGRVEGGGPPI